MKIHIFQGPKDILAVLVLFHDAESVTTPGIWASDFIAGSFHFALKHNNPRYRNILKNKFIGNGFIKFD